MDMTMPADPPPLQARPRVLPPPHPSVPAPRHPSPLHLSPRAWLRLRAVLLGGLSLGLFVAFWQVASATHLDLFLRFDNIPAPSVVAARAAAIVLTPGLPERRADQLRAGLPRLRRSPPRSRCRLGLVIGRYPIAHELIFPLSEVLRPVPAIAWVPISIMLWPTDWQSIVFITFLGAFFPILLNTVLGMRRVDPVLVLAARSLGAGEGAIFREVYLPGALPPIFTGLATGMGVAWVSLIAAEMISGQSGIGYFTWEAYSLIQYSDIVLGMVAIGLLGLVSSVAIRAGGRAAMPWIAQP